MFEDEENTADTIVERSKCQSQLSLCQHIENHAKTD